MQRQNEKEEMENNQGVSEEYIHDFCKNVHAQLCSTFCEPWTVAHQVPMSMGVSKEEYWRTLVRWHTGIYFSVGTCRLLFVCSAS